MCDCWKKAAGVEAIENVMCEGQKIIAETATVQKVKWFTQG